MNLPRFYVFVWNVFTVYFKNVFNEPDDVRKDVSLVDTDDVIVSSFDVLGQVEELGGGDGSQGLLVVSRDGVAVEQDFTIRSLSYKTFLANIVVIYNVIITLKNLALKKIVINAVLGWKTLIIKF